MPNLNYSKGANFMGNNFSLSKIVALNGDAGASPVLAAAQPGTLTTRTSSTAGTLTMTNSGHGISTGNRLDVYWLLNNVWACAYGCTVGTVSGTSVPFTLANGDVLPVATTAVTAMVPFSTTNIGLAYNAVRLVGTIAGGAVSKVVLATSGPATIFHKTTVSNSPYLWVDENADQSGNPISSGTVATTYVSHGDSSGTFTPVLSLGF